MTIATAPSAAELLKAQRHFFATGQTRPIAFRQAQLQRLHDAVLERQTAIVEAARADLGRPEYEGYFEIGVVTELKYILKHLKQWAKPRRASVPLSQKPGSAWVMPEPLGVALIIGPWNYPFQLMMSPLMGAIAAGNCAILKPSELAPATSRVIAELVRDTFDPAFVTVVEGGVDTAQALLAQKFDHIFFTGGTQVGKIVMKAAAEHLTPVTLELGGKSPCIIDKAVRLDYAAKRIVWGKFLNAGQTCVAPDYLLVHEEIKPALVTALKQAIQSFYGDDPAQSPDLSRIINDRQFDRLVSFLDNGTVIAGGVHQRDQRLITPTLLDNVSWDDPVMQEEIFGPILPIFTYRSLDEAIARITERPKPLALYLFSTDKTIQQQVLDRTSSGGVCLNDVFLQVAIWDMPFGGVGDSGIGAYHGKTSFETFSHLKSILKKPFWLDIDWRYPPYSNKVNLLKKALGL